MSTDKPLTVEDLKQKGVKIENRNKVNLRYKCLKIIDTMVSRMYSPQVLLLMQKQGYSVEKDDIDNAKKETKKKLMNRHMGSKTTKELSGAISGLLRELDKLSL